MKDGELKDFPTEAQIDFVIGLKRKITLEKGFCTDADIFLAGLKAGRPQWHDLRENPNDLPKVNGQYWVCYEDSVNIGRKGYEMWVFINEKWEHTAKVIAWCEIPTFDKE